MGTTAHGSRDGSAGPPSMPRRLGAWLLWYATIGGSVAWTVHLLVAWIVVELACAAGRHSVAGLSLRGFAAVVTVVPGLIAAGSLVAAWWMYTRRLRDVRRLREDALGRELERARFMAQIGFWADLFAVLMIAFGGVAVVVIPPCTT